MTPAPTLQELIETVERDAPSRSLLDLLTTASSTVTQLEEVADAVLGHFVDRCRRHGHSWSEISTALGVSKQAAHKRFSLPGPTLERFTLRGRGTLAARLLAELGVSQEATQARLLEMITELARQRGKVGGR